MIVKPLVVLVVGHSDKHPGAFALPPISMHEYSYNKDLAFLIGEEIKSDFDCKIIFRDGRSISETYQAIREINPDATIELHFNGSLNGMAYGTETLCSEKSIAFAVVVQEAMCDALGRTGKGKRGLKILKETYERGYHSVTVLDTPSVIVEPFFGSNTLDCVLGNEKKTELAKSIYNALWTWFIYDKGPA